jgi:CRISPR-associated endonuclease Csn1
MRNTLNLPKDRELSYAHHAVDAMLICYSQMGYESYRKIQESFIDFENEEISDMELWDRYIDDETYEDLMYQKQWSQVKRNIEKAEKNVKYWHKADRKANRGLCNQTIRGTREKEGDVFKINKLNIYIARMGIKHLKR